MGKEKRKDPHSRQAAFEMLTKQAVVESFLDEGAVHTRQVCGLMKSQEIYLFDPPKPLTRATPIDFANAVENVNAEQANKKRPFEKLQTRFSNIFREKEPNPFYNFQYDIFLNSIQISG